MPEEYVYMPVWLVVVLTFLASGAVQYLLVAAARWTDHLLKRREEARLAQHQGSGVLTLDQVRSAAAIREAAESARAKQSR